MFTVGQVSIGTTEKREVGVSKWMDKRANLETVREVSGGKESEVKLQDSSVQGGVPQRQTEKWKGLGKTFDLQLTSNGC